MKKIMSMVFIFLVGCSTQKIINESVQQADPCQLEIQHPDILRCLQEKALGGFTLLDFESTLCDCKKQFVKKYFPEDN
jgi:hypothetical protein